MKKFRADVEIEETRDGGSVVTLRGRHGNVLGMFRLAPEGSSTMSRAADAAAAGEEADNYWIALKPSDSTVFGDRSTGQKPLFDPRAILRVEEFKFRILSGSQSQDPAKETEK